MNNLFALLHKSAVVETISIWANLFSRTVFISRYVWLSFALKVFLHIIRIDEGIPILTKLINAGLSTIDRGWIFSIIKRSIAASNIFWLTATLPEPHLSKFCCLFLTGFSKISSLRLLVIASSAFAFSMSFNLYGCFAYEFNIYLYKY